MSLVTQSLGFGLVTASILAMGAVGFTLQFGVTNLFNLAFGESMTVAAFAAYDAHVDVHWNIGFAMAVGGLAGMLISLLISRLVYLPFLNRGTSQFAMVMVTVGVSIIVKNILQMFTQANYYSYQLPPQPPVHILGMVFAPRQLAIIGLAAASMLGLHLLFRHTRLGKAMRATSDDSALARSVGISTTRVVSAAWMISGMLAGLGGVALAMDLGTFDFTTGGQFLLIIVAGPGLGRVGGAHRARIRGPGNGASSDTGGSMVASARI